MTLLDKFKRISQTIDQAEQERHQELLALPSTDIQHWQARVRGAATKGEVLSLVEDFRKMPWTDSQRAQMSRCYINKLSSMD